MTVQAMAGLVGMARAAHGVWRTLDSPVRDELREWAAQRVSPRWRAVFRMAVRAL